MNVDFTGEDLLARARGYHRSGEEGRARVVSRMAVSKALSAFSLARGIPISRIPILDQAQKAAFSNHFPADQRELLPGFIKRVDECYNLP